MHLGTQYYRPPFPNNRYWDEDFKQIRDCGLDTVQLWVVWSWVEPQPDQFNYDDYDQLVALADKRGLNVVLSTIGEIQPQWIHRIVPNAELVDHRGQRIMSCNRRETHFGLSPGGCWDHPEIWQRMASFLRTTAQRYRNAAPLLGWDAWNELRWNIMAETTHGTLTCFCEHTLARWRKWLDERYGGLDGLNRAWQRRYAAWEDVQPGRTEQEPYTHHISFAEFISWRSSEHGRHRYDVIKSVDPDHPVTVHGGQPCVSMGGSPANHPVNRGNDWDFADHLDGVGCSSFPKWGVDVRSNWADFVDRITAVQSAARGKAVWLSEVQGGRASQGFTVCDPVDAASQQKWIWIGQSCGADVMLFWCWRDEVFGRESNGFGFSGRDGLAPQRMEAMSRTARVMQEHRELFDAFTPLDAEVGLWFSPRSYYLAWAQEQHAYRCVDAFNAYAITLTRASIPYRVIEERHLDALDGLKLLFMPHNLVLDDAAQQALEKWVRCGGTLVCESEVGAFDEHGIYRYPPDRWITRLTGAEEIGRRREPQAPIQVNLPTGQSLRLKARQWITPMTAAGQSAADSDEGSLMQLAPVDAGRVILMGSYFAPARDEDPAPFAALVSAACTRAGVAPPAKVIAPTADLAEAPFLRVGRAAGSDVVVVFTAASARVAAIELSDELFTDNTAKELLAGEPVEISTSGDGNRVCRFTPSKWGISVLVS